MPAAAPHPTRCRRRLVSNRKSRPSRLASPAPRTAAGPSAPTEPPPPRVEAAASDLTSTGRTWTTAPRRATAWTTSETFSPSESRVPQWTSARLMRRASASGAAKATAAGTGTRSTVVPMNPAATSMAR